MPSGSCIRDDKRTEEIKVRLTERELLDIARLAALDDRSPAEFIHLQLRRFMYGSVAAKTCATEGLVRACEGL